MKAKVITSVGMGSSVASFLVLVGGGGGGGGVASPPNVLTEKIVTYMRERLKNIYFQVSKYICIHTINAVPFYYLWHGTQYTTV